MYFGGYRKTTQINFIAEQGKASRANSVGVGGVGGRDTPKIELGNLIPKFGYFIMSWKFITNPHFQILKRFVRYTEAFTPQEYSWFNNPRQILLRQAKKIGSICNALSKKIEEMLSLLAPFAVSVKFFARLSGNKNAHELPKQHENGVEGEGCKSLSRVKNCLNNFVEDCCSEV